MGVRRIDTDGLGVDMTPLIARREPEVTVLMSCRNASRWLQEAIESVLTQTFPDFEFVLIDDGSSDRTWEIVQQYAKCDSRIVPIAKRPTGLSDSLNVGINRARGRWIARLDADDLSEPTRLQEQVRFVRSHPTTVLLGSAFIEIDESGRSIRRHSYPASHLGKV